MLGTPGVARAVEIEGRCGPKLRYALTRNLSVAVDAACKLYFIYVW
jgi:hypothetical protein